MSTRRSKLTSENSAIGHLVSQAQQSLADQEAAAAGKTGQGKPANSGTKGVDKYGRAKITLRLDITTQTLIRDLAQQENLSNDEIVRAGIVLLAEALQSGKLDLQVLKTIEYSQKQPWRGVARLELPQEFGFFSEPDQP